MKSTILQLIEKHKQLSILEISMSLRLVPHDDVVKCLNQMLQDGEITKVRDIWRFPTEEEKQRWSNFQNWLDAGKAYIDADTRIDIIQRYLNRK